MTNLRRSFDVYYRDRDRTARMDALHQTLIATGALVFDIGAHLGDRTGSALRLGAKVVALEPQPRVFRALRLLYGSCPDVTLIPSAVGAMEGAMALHVNTANPTVSTLATQFIAAADGAPCWDGQMWDETITVPVTTLDALIAAHGRPDFVKVDVEGHEAEVLQGLSHALPLLSFEITMIQREVAFDCLEQLSQLAAYRFNLSLGEEHRLRYANWLEADAMRSEIAALPEAANSGDIFAWRE